MLDPTTGKVKLKKPAPKKKKPKSKKPKQLTPEEMITQELDGLLEEDFEFGLLESCELVFPITDPVKKLTTFQERLQRIARNKRIHELAIGGAVIRQISTQLTKAGWPGASRSNVSKVLKKCLQISEKDADLTINERRRLELEKLDQAELMHFTRFLRETNPTAAEKLSQIMDRIWRRRDNIEGLHKPIKVDIDPQKTLAKLLGRDPQELPSGDVES